MKHIVLLGDSIFDNQSYVGGGKDTIANLREQMPDDWTATLLAVDGHVTDGVIGQIARVPADATHLFVSVGGNDALGEMSILQMPASSAMDVLNEISNVAARFEDRYKRMLDAIRALGKPTAVCTVYYPRFPEAWMQKLAVAALASFNDVIIRHAFLAGIPLIDLRYVCDDDRDYANPIEPSEAGGAKIAKTIIQVVNEESFSVNRTSVYLGSNEPADGDLDKRLGEIVASGVTSGHAFKTLNSETEKKPFPVAPPSAEYTRGFEAIRDRLSKQQVALLRAHYHSEGYRASVHDLARKCGIDSWRTVNRQYGEVAKLVLTAMGYDKPESEAISLWLIGLVIGFDNMEMTLRPEVVKALVRAGIVDENTNENHPDDKSLASSDEGQNAADTSDDNSDAILADRSEINDFIVYHNPDAMGPLSANPDFRVFTNRGVSKATVGDRVWLITGEGDPRKYYLASWFYIDEFSSGEDEGFKHCIAGSEGNNYSPFVEIERGEWFDRLKHDQGNFAFGFSRINTPGAVENLEAIEDRTLFGFLHQWMLEALEVERDGTISADEWGPRSLFNAISKTRAFLHKFGTFIYLDVDSWGGEAERLLGDVNELRQLDLLTLRKLVSYINHVNERTAPQGLEYWLDLARSGQLPIIVGRLREIFFRERRRAEWGDEAPEVTGTEEETSVRSFAAEPASSEGTATSETDPVSTEKGIGNSKLRKYEWDERAIEKAARILVITGKGHSAEFAHVGITRFAATMDQERIEDLSLLTQNINGSFDLVELRGDVNETLCLSCGHSQSPGKLATGASGQNYCPRCSAKESVALCVRMLNDDDLRTAYEKARKCDVCIIVDSSELSDSALRVAEVARGAGAYLFEITPRETAVSDIMDGVWVGNPVAILHFLPPPRVNPKQEKNSDTETTEISGTHPIKVDFIRSEEFPLVNRLGMVFAPGLSLDEGEAGRLQLGDVASEDDITLIRLQVPADKAVPDPMTDFVTMAANFGRALRHGKFVIVHCKDNQAFVSLTAASIAIAASDAEISASKAIELVCEAHPGAIETEVQEQFIKEFEKEWQEVMAERGDHYLLYWQERSVLDHAANEKPLDVVASNGLFGVEPGDTLWIVTLTQERELFLAGRLVVGEIVEYEEAMRRMPDAGLWQSEYYAFPEPGTEEFIRPLPLTEIAEELRFDGENDRLTLRDGKINPQQLRKRRKLTRDTAELIDRIWEESAEITDPEELVAVWQHMVEENPEDPEAHYNLAVALTEVGREEDAVREYEETIRLDPNYFPALYNLGNHLARVQRFDEAIELFNRAILVDGDYAPAHFMLGVAYFESGRYDDAVASTRQGLEIDPEDESAYYNLAYWAYRLGDYRSAIAQCDDLIARAPLDKRIRLVKGKCFRKLGDIEKEIEAYKEVLAIPDQKVEWVIELETVYALGAAWERKITGSDIGIEYLEVFDQIDLDDSKEEFYFAMGHLAQGESDFARQALEHLLYESPDLGRRLETALRYVESASSENHPTKADILADQEPQVGLQEAPSGGERGPVEHHETKPARKRQPRKQIRLSVGGTEITAKHIPDLYYQVLKMLVGRGALDNLELPISSGRKRHFLSRTPTHKDGSNFLAPVEYGGYYMESHSSRENGIRMLRGFLTDLGIESYVMADEGEAIRDGDENMENVD